MPISIRTLCLGLMALTFGAPFCLIWVAALAYFTIRKSTSWLYLLLLAFFAVDLWITNSILWEAWLFYFALTFWVVRCRSMDETRRDQ
jgi:hypothetical protein